MRTQTETEINTVAETDNGYTEIATEAEVDT